MIRAVLDTNVLVSAVIFGGKPEQILDLARVGEVGLCISPPLLAEFAGVLTDKFRFSPEMGAAAVMEVSSLTILVTPSRSLHVVKDDEPDNRVLECALTASAHYIVSGDRHLLGLKVWKGISILTPAQFLRVQALKP